MLEFSSKTKCLARERLRDRLQQRRDLKPVALVILLLVILVLISPLESFSELDTRKRGVTPQLPATPNTVDLPIQPGSADSPCANISDCAYQLLNQRSMANRADFFVYKDADSAFNHSFASGLFGNIDLTRVLLDANCVDDPASPSGCSSDLSRLDKTHGTVFRFRYPALSGSSFVGLNWQEPENYSQAIASLGYNLIPADRVVLEARSPDSVKVQFGVGGCVTNFYQLGPLWNSYTISIEDLLPPPGPSNVTCPTDLSDTHILFTVATNGSMSPNGGTVLLDNIRFLPVPLRQFSDPKALSLPLGNETFGAVLQNALTPDQVNRNLAPIYEAAATVLALLKRGRAEDVENALRIADALDYALHHDNHGNPLPVAPDGSRALRSAYQGGDIALLNRQASGAQAGDIRLAGFSVKDGSCGPTGFCLVLDGTTGGNNAWAMLALLAAYLRTSDVKYLEDAKTIGNWIVAMLKDPATPTTNPASYGGYFVGFTDGGTYFPIHGKSTENNGDIFVAFALLARIENDRGNAAAGALWQARANVAGDFVMQMFDPINGRFYAGTVTVDPPSPPNPIRGNCQTTPPLRSGNDIINVCDFLDSNTFTILPLAASPQYHSQIDWRRPLQFTLDHFAQTVTVAGRTYSGFDLVTSPSSGPNAVTWEFTGQAIATERFIAALYNEPKFEDAAIAALDQVRQAQISAPFGDGLGLPASTIQDGDQLAPTQQCHDTPFQCISERVGLAATTWAIFAHQGFNPLWFGSLAFSPQAPSFSDRLVGTSSPPATIVIRNTAVAAVNFRGAFSLAGPNTQDFAVTDNCHSGPLPAGATCSLTIVFSPAAAGTRTANVVINSDALGSPHSINLIGRGLPLNDFSLALSPQPQSIIAGSAATYSLQTQVTRGNSQSLALSASCPGLTCGFNTNNINSGSSATLTVTTSIGTVPNSYAVTVMAIGPEVTHSVQTNLVVQTGAVVSPTALTFAPQQAGTNAVAQVVTLTNNSAVALTIRAISIGGSFASDFAQSNNCGATLAAGTNCVIRVTFKPTGVGPRNALLFVFDDAGNSPQTVALRGAGFGSCTTINDCAFQSLIERLSENTNGFFVYRDSDSARNRGFPSGLFGSPGFDLSKINLDSACVDDLTSPSGCTVDRQQFDASRGTVFRVVMPPLAPLQFAGLNFEEPQNFNGQVSLPGGYDLRPATMAKIDARSPNRMVVRFGVGGCATPLLMLDSSWQTLTIPFNTLLTPPNYQTPCTPDLTNVHLLFSVLVSGETAPAGGIVLLDNVQFLPVPLRQTTASGIPRLPVSVQTVGVVANQRLPIPPDQVNQNLATIADSSLSCLALLRSEEPGDVAHALRIADAFHYALYHDNHGVPIPTGPQSTDGCYLGMEAGQCGLHSAYMADELPLKNNQPLPALGRAGDVRLAGFSSGPILCGPSKFCLVLDGATGGDNALAVLALVEAYNHSGNLTYLHDAEVIGNWIFGNLSDNSGYGGYIVGYNDGGLPKQLIRGKSTVHNAQIFAALSHLSRAEATRGDARAASMWMARANAAANFVLKMFEPSTGRFLAGSVDSSSVSIQGPGLCPDPARISGSDVINACDSLDSNTSAVLALIDSFPNTIDWTLPIYYALNNFRQTVTAGGKTFSGFHLVIPSGPNQNGIAWEFTSQMVLAMKLVDARFRISTFANYVDFYENQMHEAQVSAPFGDGRGIVKATLPDGHLIPPYSQCLKTPFQCIPQRVGIGASAWSAMAATNHNPLNPSAVAGPTPTPGPAMQLLLELSGPTTTQAAALDSMLFTRDPFPIVNVTNFLIRSDHNTRVILFVTNLQLAPGEVPSAVVVDLLDSSNVSFHVPAEDVRAVPAFDFTQVIFRLPDNLAAGQCVVRVIAHGQVTNIGTIRIQR